MSIAVSIVEDSEPYREKLTALLRDEPGIRFVSAHATAEEALAKLPPQGIDIVLVDILLPEMSGMNLTRELKRRDPALLVVALTVVHDSEVIFKMLQAGADGYLVKGASSAEVLRAITEVKAGGAPMSPGVARKVMQFFHRLPQPAPELETLSKRQMEVLSLLSSGCRNKEIADKLEISINTVSTHIRNILTKLQVASRAEATTIYVEGQKVARHPRPVS